MSCGIYLYEGPRDCIPTRGVLRPHQKATLSPRKSGFPGWQFSGEAPEKAIATCSTAKECHIWQLLRFLPLCFSGILWLFTETVGALALKSNSEMLKEEIAKIVRKLHPLHLLQLPVFTMSFAMLIQGCQEKQNKNREGTFSTLSTWHQVLQTAHFTSENILPDRLILFQILIFFSDFTMYLPC